MKIKKTFQGELPENRVVNTYSDSLTDAYSANYLNDKLKSVEVSSTEPTNGKDIWVQMGKNLFNKYSKLISGKYLASDGTIGDDANLFYQETYIPVEPNTSYVISNENNENHRICEYDADKTFLTRFLNDNASLSCIFTSGPSTKFIRISCRIDNIDSLQIEQGEFKTDYEPYIPKKIYVKKNDSYDLVYDEINTQKEVYVGLEKPLSGEEVWLQKGKNLFNKNNFVKINAYIDTTTSLVTSNEHNRVLYIECLPNTTYTIQKVVSGVFGVGYTNELPKAGVQAYNIINDATLSNATITTGNSAKYIVVRYYHTGNDTTYTEQQILDSIQIEIGDKATPYEPYIDKKIYIKNNNGIYEEFYKEKTEVVLFSGSALGDVTLLDNVNNYKYIEVIGESGAKHSCSVKCLSNAKKIALVTVEIDAAYSDNVGFVLIGNVFYIKGNLLELDKAGRLYKYQQNNVVVDTNNSMYIKRVIGYK